MSNQSVISQFQAAKKYPLAAIWGAIMGAAIPVGVYWLSHSIQVVNNPKLWYLVYAGLAFSGLTVCSAMYRIANGNTWLRAIKAFAFTVLLEGTMTFAADWRLTSGMLVLLIALNALEFAYTMVSRHDNWLEEKEAEIKQAVTEALDSYKKELQAKRERLSAKRKASQANKQTVKAKKSKGKKTVQTSDDSQFENVETVFAEATV